MKPLKKPDVIAVLCRAWVVETQAANEPDHSLIADVYLLQLEGQPQIQAEIAQMKWISVDDQHTPLAPLTREIVLPWCVNYLASRETEAAATQTG